MRNIIFGSIGVLWGGAVILYSLLGDKSPSGGAYGAGQMAGSVFGFLFFAVGLYYLVQGIRTLGESKVVKKKKKKKKKVIE